MAGIISKRQQARNERALQDLIRTVPGNDRCADCMARNPGWASWSLGIFLCMRCAALHRKLGTHLSKVKSLSMDSWSSDQVENMKRNGNATSNRQYNPRNIEASMPMDSDEVDGAMERYIREKYQTQTLGTETAQSAAKHDADSTGSDEDDPPPLPPKPTSRFSAGLRAASSTFPLSRNKPHPPLPVDTRRDTRRGSKALGAYEGGPVENLDPKLLTLADMGFTDKQRNTLVLQGVKGDVPKAVEVLVRLGEGDRSARAAARVSASAMQSGSPVPQPSSKPQTLSVQQQESQPELQPPAFTADHTIAAASHTTTTLSPNNPFNQASQTQPVPPASAPLEQSFQNLQISQQPQQMLFPNNTGGWAGHDDQQQNQNNPFLKTFTPPISPSPFQYSTSMSQEPLFSPSQPYQPQQPRSNPFLLSSQSQTFSPSNLSASQMSYTSTYSHMPQQEQPPVPSIPTWAQQHSPSLDQQPIMSSPYNPFLQQPQSQLQNQPVLNPQAMDSAQYGQPTGYPFQMPQSVSQQPPALQSQMTGRYDKNSILALYNYPQLAPAKPSSTPQESDDNVNKSEPGHLKQRSVTMPVVAPPASGSLNPFTSAGGNAVNAQKPQDDFFRNVSHDSIDFVGLLNGRHSPDAFASLSARYG